MDFADFGEADSATPNVIKRHYASPAVDAAEQPEGAISQLVDEAKKSGDPGAIRTRDPQLRRLVLYPAELPGHERPEAALDLDTAQPAIGWSTRIFCAAADPG